ncbi:hypothetical protein TrVGV298_000388 [Trichoderma virens]|nr:hypothetical protein TrVGV298_000388 [Trichoderma virens]
MRLRSVTRRACAWLRLPAEIRLMILEIVAAQKHRGWASLASVCREWQHVLEKVNFRKVKLRASCLDGFESIISPQKRELIHHICLNVELPRCRGKCCVKVRPPPVALGPLLRDAISKLFSILSLWGPMENLALELNVYSTSDREHWFKNIYLSSDNVEDGTETEPDVCIEPLYHDPKYGWMHGRQFRAPPKTAIERLFGSIPLNFDEELPPVQAVTSFIIRRQLRRYIPPFGFAHMMEKFHRLEHILYEPWAPSTSWTRYFHDRDLSYVMRFFPDTLNSLTIFEDSYEFYDRFPRRRVPDYMLDMDVPSRAIGRDFASKSLSLQHFAISFMVNAEDVFRACHSTWCWQHLQSLALTSELLQANGEKRDWIEVLLCRAGDLAQQMPKIHTFVLWNGGKGNACAFVYRIVQGRGSVTWRGTWLLKLSPRVIESWQLANSKLRVSRPELQLKQEQIQATIRSPGDAIYHLKLPCQVIEPASLWQIRREACIGE